MLVKLSDVGLIFHPEWGVDAPGTASGMNEPEDYFISESGMELHCQAWYCSVQCSTVPPESDVKQSTARTNG